MIREFWRELIGTTEVPTWLMLILSVNAIITGANALIGWVIDRVIPPDLPGPPPED